MDAFLIPENSLMQANRPQMGYTFDTNSDRGEIRSAHIRNLAVTTAKIQDAAITSAKIDSFSFNSGTGGTITLGGAANGDGLMLVKDSGGTTKVTVDNTGIAITDGKLTFLNSSGGTAIDSAGIVSTNNFTFAQGTAGTAGQSITSSGATWTDITGGSVTLTVTRATNVLLNYSVTAYHNDFDGMGVVRIFDGTTVYGPNISVNGGWEGAVPETFAMSFIQQFPAGSYVLRMQAKQNNSPGTLTLGVGGIANTPAVINYVALGN